MDGIVGRRRRGAPRRGVTVLVALAALATGIGAATAPAPAGAALPACTRTWTGGTGSWTDAARWSGGVVPTTTDHVCIAAGSGTVELRSSVTVASLSLGAGAPTDPVRVLAIVPEGQAETAALTATQGVVVEPRGEVVLTGTPLAQSPGGTARLIVGDGAEIANRGALKAVEGASTQLLTIYGRLVNTGYLQVNADVSVDEVVNDGSIAIDRSTLQTVRFEGRTGGLTGSGWVRAADLVQGAMESGAGNDATWPVLQVYNGDIAVTGPGRATIEARGDVDLTGAVHARQRLLIVSQPDLAADLLFRGMPTNAGGITLRPVEGRAATLRTTVTGALGTLANDGVVDVQQVDDTPARIVADVVNRGLLVLDEGTTEVSGDVRNEGRIDLRLGFLDVDRDLDLRATGLLAVDGDTDADTNGYVDANGQVDVDGRLAVRTIGAAPAIGSRTTVVNGNALDGTFDELIFGGPASYDAEYGPTQVNLVRRGPETPGERFVRASHQDFLDRQPTTAELEDLGALVDGGSPRATLVRALAGSPEYVSALVQRYYLDTLGRPGEAGGVAYWVGELRSGRMTVAQVAGSFYASQEYVDRSGGTLPSWIGDLYDVFFDRPPSDTDLDYWIARTLARGRTRVAVELFQSLESRFQRVDRLYLDLLGRVAEPDGKVYWAGRITREGDLALAVSLASSGEYLARAQQRYP
jgi:hypothetical protein